MNTIPTVKQITNNKQQTIYYILNTDKKNLKWKQSNKSGLLELFVNEGLTESKINNALRGNKQYGRITLINNSKLKEQDIYLYVSKFNSPALLSISEERLLFDKWIQNNYIRVRNKLVTINNKKSKDYRVDEDLVDDCFADAIVYLLENIDRGKSVNDFETLLTFKTDYAIKDTLKRKDTTYTQLVENVYNEKIVVEGKEIIPEYINQSVNYNTMHNECEYLQRINNRNSNKKDDNNHFESVVEIAEDSIFGSKIPFFEEDSCLESVNVQVKYDMVFQVLISIFGENVVNVYLEYLKLDKRNKEDKIKQLSIMFKQSKIQITKWLNSIDNVLYNKTVGVKKEDVEQVRKHNSLIINELRNATESLYELNRYKGVEDYELSDLIR